MADHLPGGREVQEHVHSRGLTECVGVPEPASSGTLEQAGFIRNRRGHVTILDVEALEEVSCECYRLIREQEAELLG